MSVSDDIKLAVERAAGQPATHLESVPVFETINGKVIWKGMVEVYSLAKPPPDRGYGWAVNAQPETQYVAVLGTPPINSPIAAVRAWAVSEIRNNPEKFRGLGAKRDRPA